MGFGVVWGMRNGSDEFYKPCHEGEKIGRSHSDLMALIVKARFGELCEFKIQRSAVDRWTVVEKNKCGDSRAWKLFTAGTTLPYPPPPSGSVHLTSLFTLLAQSPFSPNMGDKIGDLSFHFPVSARETGYALQ